MKSTFITIHVHRNHIHWSLVWKRYPYQHPFRLDSLLDVSWCSRCPISLAARAYLAPLGFEGTISAANGQLCLYTPNPLDPNGPGIYHKSHQNLRAREFMDVVDNSVSGYPLATTFMFQFRGDLSHLFPLDDGHHIKVTTEDATVFPVR
jgi:hypothetical protein